MKKIILIIIYLLIYKVTLCQFTINEINFIGDSKKLNNDSILSIPLSVFNSITINQLEIPNNIQEEGNCYGCRGTIFVGFMIDGKKIISTKVLRGFNNKFDSILLKQHTVVLNNIIKYSNLKPDNFYYITIPIKYMLDDYNEYNESQKFVQIDTKNATYINYIYVLLDKKPVIINY